MVESGMKHHKPTNQLNQPLGCTLMGENVCYFHIRWFPQDQQLKRKYIFEEVDVEANFLWKYTK